MKPNRLSLWSVCAAWLLWSGFLSHGQTPLSVVDRIGGDTASTDGQPGGLMIHYDHGTAKELWGTCGTAWKQPKNGTLAEVAFVGFARVVNPTNGMYLSPVTNLSAFSMSLHLWTNGTPGFLAGTNAAKGDLVIPLGSGPVAPAWWLVRACPPWPAAGRPVRLFRFVRAGAGSGVRPRQPGPVRRGYKA